MSDASVESRRGRSMQFSLRTLMFVMFVVAVCAALIHISPVLAIGAAPFILGALMRMPFGQAQGRIGARHIGATSGLVITFFQSMFLLVGLVVACFATMIAGAVLISMTIIDRAFMMIRRFFQVCAPYTGKLLRILWVAFRRFAAQIDLGRILHWIRLQSAGATVWLVSASRILFRRCIYPGTTQALHSANAPN